MPDAQPAAKPTVWPSAKPIVVAAVVAAVAPADEPDKAKEGIFNLILSKANVETSLLARLCIAICEFVCTIRLAMPMHAL